MKINELTGIILDAALAVHRELGSDLLESAYEACLRCELRSRGLKVEKQVALPVFYRGVQIDAGDQIDLLVEDLIIIELKVVEGIHPIHQSQIISYLKLSQKPLGLLINFHVTKLKDGFKHFVRPGHNINDES